MNTNNGDHVGNIDDATDYGQGDGPIPLLLALASIRRLAILELRLSKQTKIARILLMSLHFLFVCSFHNEALEFDVIR